MSEIVQGLFGVSPEQLQMQQDQALQARAMQYAQMSPQEQSTAAIYSGVSKLGGALGGMLGGVDPVQQQASKIASVLQGADQTTAEGMMDIAKRFADVNLPQQSQMAVAKAQEMAKAKGALAAQGAETLLKTAQAGALPGETALRLAQAKKAGFDQLSEEQAQAAAKAALQEQGNMSEAQIEAIIKNPKSRESYFGYIADKTQITDAGGRVLLINKENGKIIKDLGAAAERGTRINLSVTQKGEEAFVTELGKLDAKSVAEAATKSNIALEQLGTLQKMAEVVQRPVISGSMAEQRTDVANFFNTIGLSSSADRIKTANSQEYIKYSTGLVLDNLKKTGYNPSNADMKVVQALIPRLETDPIARTELIKFMAEKAKLVVTESARLDEYARKNKGLSGYKPLIPQITFGGKSSNPYADISDAELNARIEAAKAKLPKQ